MRGVFTIIADLGSRVSGGCFVGLLTASLFLSACGSPEPDSSESTDVADEIPFRVDGHLQFIREGEILAELEIEIAETDSARTRGMMQRKELPTSRGMLFIFDSEEDRLFWMANTPLSLDLIFVGADSTIIRTAKYMTPLSPQDVPSMGPAQFVLELIAGSVDTLGLIEGDQLAWTRMSGD